VTHITGAVAALGKATKLRIRKNKAEEVRNRTGLSSTATSILIRAAFRSVWIALPVYLLLSFLMPGGLSMNFILGLQNVAKLS
jgi:hypothetical protein